MANITQPIQQLIAELEQKKASLKKRAEEPATSHPVGSVDNSTQPLTTGEQAKANEKMIKEDVPGTSVDAAAPLSQSPTEQDKQQITIGMNPASTGQDPSVEKDIKDKPSDPGTSHPAKTDVKSASAYLASAEVFSKSANAFLSNIASQAANPQQTPATPAPKAASTAEDDETIKAAQFGYQLAAELGLVDLSDNSLAHKTVTETIKNAALDASLVVDYLTGFGKQALSEMQGESHMAPDATETGSGSAAAVDPGAAEGSPGPAPEDIEAILAQIGAEEAPEEPAEDAPPSEDELLEQLAAALAEREMPPEELPTKMASTSRYSAEDVKRIANSVVAFKKAGKFKFRPAATKRAMAIREQVSGIIREIVGS
jgi:hypothetical protein